MEQIIPEFQGPLPEYERWTNRMPNRGAILRKGISDELRWGDKMKCLGWIMAVAAVVSFGEVAIVVVWRILCFFRREGSCKFVKCPFRRDYASVSDLALSDSGCTKCGPTEQEMEILMESLNEIAEEYAASAREELGVIN